VSSAQTHQLPLPVASRLHPPGTVAGGGIFTDITRIFSEMIARLTYHMFVVSAWQRCRSSNAVCDTP